MPITIDGTGSISGLSTGGLPDLSVQTADLADSAVTTAKIAAGAIVAADLDGAQFGSAPIYAARAWVNFNGQGTVAVRGSGNVTSITDNGTGDYTINFTVAVSDANGGVVVTSSEEASRERIAMIISQTTTTARVRIRGGGGTADDPSTLALAVFR